MFFIAGAVSGRVRALYGDDGKVIEEAGPSIPAEILGAAGTPQSGDDFYVLESESDTKRLSQIRATQERKKRTN